jgi:hypothetical protein
VAAWPGTGELDVKISDSRRIFNSALVVVAAIAAVTICALSYFSDPHRLNAAQSQIDLLSENLGANWSVFGALTATEVTFNRISDGFVEIRIRTDNASWSSTSSGVNYKVGLYDPGWYQFSGKFKADANPLKGTGAQLELHSDRWRLSVSAGQPVGDGWKVIDVYFRPSYSDPGVEVSCRFWGRTGDPAGRAFLRDLRIAKLDGAPPASALQFDLAKKEEARLGKPRRQRNPTFRSLELTVVILVLIIGASWRLLAGA